MIYRNEIYIYIYVLYIIIYYHIYYIYIYYIFLKTVLVPQGEVLTGFERNFIASMEKTSASRYLNKILIKLERFLEDLKWQSQLIIIEKAPR